MVRFDDVRFTGGGSSRLDNVRVDGTLRQPFDVVQLQRFFVEHFHEHATDNFTLGFRIAFTRQRVEETLLAFNVNNVQAKVVAEHLHHLLRFVQAQQTVVHEYAGQVLPIARCSSIAVTEESTPPERPRITLSSPTC